MSIETLLRDLDHAAGVESAPPGFAARVRRTTPRRAWRWCGAGALVVAGAVAVAGARGGGGPVHETYVPSGSMQPTVAIGEHVIWDSRLAPQVGDVVVVRLTDEGRTFDAVKRVQSLDRAAGTAFVVGDDAEDSLDSRQLGPVALGDVEGVVVRIAGVDGHRRVVPGAPSHADPGGDVDPAGDAPPAQARPADGTP